ncbi:hypothetical protein ACQY0O_005852 [Thecaphora frezii]
MSERRASPPRRSGGRDLDRDRDRDWRSGSSRYNDHPSRSYGGGSSSHRRSVSPHYRRDDYDYRRGGGGPGRGDERDRRYSRDEARDRSHADPRMDGRPPRPAPAPYEATIPPARDDDAPYRDRRRSRSRSPPRYRSRADEQDRRKEHNASSRYPDRDRDRRRDSHRDPDRERESHRDRDRHRHDDDQQEDGEVDDEDASGADAAAGPSEEDMMKMLGFGGFGTTKGKKVAANEAGAAEIKKERTWRQYMNRRGGFNRPLDKI